MDGKQKESSKYLVSNISIRIRRRVWIIDLDRRLLASIIPWTMHHNYP